MAAMGKCSHIHSNLPEMLACGEYRAMAVLDFSQLAEEPVRSPVNLFFAFDAHTEVCSACAHSDYCWEGRALRQAWLAAEASTDLDASASA